MTTFRVHKNKDYFRAYNQAFQDRELSWEAKGLMGYILSLPDDWEVQMSDLINNFPAGRDKVRRIVSELEAHGYMHRGKERNDDGTFSWYTNTYERKEDNPNYSTTDVFSVDGESTDGKPTDIQKTDRQSTNRQKQTLSPPPDKLSPPGGNGNLLAQVPKKQNGTSSPDGLAEETESTAENKSPNGDGPTRNSRQQALYELESLFCKLTNLKPPPRKTKKQQRAAGARWWSPLGTIYSHLAEEDLDQAKRILTIATTRMKTDGLTISAPQSIEQVANAVYAEISQQPKVSVGEGGSYVF